MKPGPPEVPRLILLRRPIIVGQPTQGSWLWENPKGSIRHLGIRCLELPWHDNAPQTSCIPIGEYVMEYTLSSRFHEMMWAVKDVKDRAGIRIHAGNYAGDKLTNSEGCLLPCLQWADINGDGVIDGTASKRALAMLAQQLKPYEATGIRLSIQRAVT